MLLIILIQVILVLHQVAVARNNYYTNTIEKCYSKLPSSSL